MKYIPALILSAGESKRMGKTKALLKIGKKTFLEDQVKRLQKSGIEKIFVVVGCHTEEIMNTHPDLKVEWVVNENWQDGNFSSVRCGATSISPSPQPSPPRGEGVLILPIDVVGVEPEIIRQIIETGLETDHNIIPTFEGRGGHPVYLRPRMIKRIIENTTKDNRLDYLLRDDPKTKRVSVNSRHILNNVNTLVDLATLNKLV